MEKFHVFIDRSAAHFLHNNIVCKAIILIYWHHAFLYLLLRQMDFTFLLCLHTVIRIVHAHLSRIEANRLINSVLWAFRFLFLAIYQFFSMPILDMICEASVLERSLLKLTELRIGKLLLWSYHQMLVDDVIDLASTERLYFFRVRLSD